MAIARETAGQLGLGQNILDASSFGDTHHHEPGQLAESIENAEGFAQVFPEHKFHIVDVLEHNNHIVGMRCSGGTNTNRNSVPRMVRARSLFGVLVKTVNCGCVTIRCSSMAEE